MKPFIIIALIGIFLWEYNYPQRQIMKENAISDTLPCRFICKIDVNATHQRAELNPPVSLKFALINRCYPAKDLNSPVSAMRVIQTRMAKRNTECFNL